MGRDADGEKTTGDIGTLGLGFGIFQAWLFMAVFTVIRIFEPSGLTGFGFYLPEHLANTILYVFLGSSALTLIFIGVSNQKYLRFYVSKLAMWIGAGLCSIGTLITFLACIPFAPDTTIQLGSIIAGSDPLVLDSAASAAQSSVDAGNALNSPISFTASVVSGIFMGVGSSLLIALWGTGFARVKFTTIVLNACLAIPLGVIIAFLLSIWIPAPISGVVTAALPFLAIIFLRVLTPMPYYQRREKPIFDPFPPHKTSYIVSLGIPTVIMGIPLGALRLICVGEVLPSGNITIQLVLGASCALSIVVFVSAIAIARRNPYWDTLFRNIVPIIVIGSASIPFISGEYAVPAAFLVSLAYICLEVLMWVFFADLSNRFSMSPLFVFGIGRGILEVAGILGSALAIWAFHDSLMDIGGLTLLALVCAVLMSMGYSLLPRYREFKSILDKNGDPEASTAHAVIGPRVAATEAARVAKAAAADVAETAATGAHDASQDPNSTRAIDRAIERDDGLESAPTGISSLESTSGNEASTDHLTYRLAAVGTKGSSFESATEPGEAPYAQSADEALMSSENAENPHEKGSFRRRCDEIADQYVLSKREREVLPLLAKGHNASYIQDALCVSKSTAKTHINHIYKKMDIHNQQELLTMVEDRHRGPSATSADGANVEGKNTNDASERMILSSNYMVDKNAYAKTVSQAVAHPAASRPKPKNGYRASIFSD